ncbi:MAG: hypothetical protein QM784_36715 [Polyangiaceae bacterium]
MMYVLDEPSIGLHQRDNARLIETLVRLRDLGTGCSWSSTTKTRFVYPITSVDFGSGAGHLGGGVVFTAHPTSSCAPKTASPASICVAKNASTRLLRDVRAKRSYRFKARPSTT